MTSRKHPLLPVLAAVALAGCMGGTATAPAPAGTAAGVAAVADAAVPARPAPGRGESRRDARARGMGLVEADGLETYANKVARQIVERNGLAGKVDVVVAISADRTPGAYVERNGLVVVPIGLLMDFQNEDELAFVLGHEIAHVELGHHDAGWLQRHQRQAVRLVESATRVEDALGRSLRIEGTKGGLDESYAKAQAYLTAADRVLFTYWSRKQERAADARGRELMKAAGYNPNVIEGVFEVMSRWEGIERRALVMLKDGLAVAGINDPETNRMVNQLERLFEGGISEGEIAQQGYRFTGGQGGRVLPEVGKVLKQPVDKVGGWLRDKADAAAEGLDIGHPSIEKRMADMALLNEADPFDGEVNTSDYTTAISPAPTKALLDSYRLAFAARQALDERQWPLAFEKAQAALRGPAADHAQQRLTIAAIRTARGNRGEARGDLTRATGVREPALRPFVQLAAAYEAEGDLGGARVAINDAEAALGERPETMQAKTRLLVREGNTNLANATAERCQVKFPEARAQCMEPVGGGGGFRLPNLRF